MPASKLNNGLTEKQEAFCQEFIKNKGNRTKAYKNSHNTSKMKPETINRKAKEIYDYGKIRARITELQEDAKKRNNLTIDDLLQHLKSYVNFNPQDILNKDGTLKDVHDLPKEIAMCISELNIDTVILSNGQKQVKTKVKINNKLDSIEKIAKHLGMYEKDNKQKQSDLSNISTEELIKRAKAIEKINES